MNEPSLSPSAHDIQLLRSKYSEDVAEALYRADKLSPDAKLRDCPVDKAAPYRQLAEAVVMLAVDGTLREASYYCFADKLLNEIGKPMLHEISLRERVMFVSDVRTSLNHFFRWLRGFYPNSMTYYTRMVEQDNVEMAKRKPVKVVGLKDRGAR